MRNRSGLIVCGLLLAAGSASAAQSGFLIQESLDQNGQVQSRTVLRKQMAPERVTTLRNIPALLAEDLPTNGMQFREIWIPANDASALRLSAEVLQEEEEEVLAGTEVRTLVNQGPPSNRIDLTIVGDGYTQAQKGRFFADAQRMSDDLFGEQTFASYLPLFNVHAVFVPSRDSGLTDGANRKQTALGLYRNPPGSKRAIMPGSSWTIDRYVRQAPDTDYPILMANDDFYGGLGGKYAITTRSQTSGSMVLRHELGHNFGNVGEEYDGGQVYSGANFSSSSRSLRWQKWIEPGSRNVVNDAQFLAGRYVWDNLRDGSYRTHFDFPRPIGAGAYRFRVKISTVGWATPQDVEARIDGQRVELLGHFTADRGFLTLSPNFTMAPGRHVLEFTEKVRDGDNVLAFAQLFALPADYNESPTETGAYSVFDHRGSKRGYRPTHNGCLMRNMEIKEFCNPDKENMWIRFLSRVSLIDGVSVSGDSAELRTPNLGSNLKVKWIRVTQRGESELTSLRDQRRATRLAAGRYRVDVEFETPEVRSPTGDFRKSQIFEIR